MKPTCHIADAVIGDGPADSPVESTLSALGAALKARDAGTHAHSQRLTSYALALGRLLGLPRTELLTLERGVFLHDIGKTYVSEGILRKSGPLSRTEWVEMRSRVFAQPLRSCWRITNGTTEPAIRAG